MNMENLDEQDYLDKKKMLSKKPKPTKTVPKKLVTTMEADLVKQKPIIEPKAKPKSKTEAKPAVKPEPKSKLAVKPKPEPNKEAPKEETKKVEAKPAVKPKLDEEALQKKFKEETGKNAIWRGAETKAYKEWKENQ